MFKHKRSGEGSKNDIDDLLPLRFPKRLRGGGGEGIEDPDCDVEHDIVDIEEPSFDEEIYIPDDDSDEFDMNSGINTHCNYNVHKSLLPENLILKSSRPPLTITSNDQDLTFQWLDMDVIGGKPLTQNPNASATHVVGATSSPQVPILRVFGVTMQGNSVAAFLHGFTPYGYFAVPSSCDTSDATLGRFRSLINAKLSQAVTRASSAGSANTAADLVLGVQLVKHCTSLLGYNSKHDRFLKIHVAMPTLIPTLKRVLEQGIVWPGHSHETSFAPFECNVPFVLRFLIDRDICGAGWLTLPKNTFQIRRASRQTHCQVSILHIVRLIEITVHGSPSKHSLLSARSIHSSPYSLKSMSPTMM